MDAAASGVSEDVLAELRPELDVLRPLGSGATSNVYLAREPALQRLVAVKVLRGDVATDAVTRQRFEREAQSAARISHPNVTAIYRVGRLSGDVPYIVMEYIDGRTVRDVVESGTTFDYGYARSLLAAVAGALAAAHDRGIVHRDVRPGNVYVENRTARAVLGDFGIAALLESGAAGAPRLTAAGVRLGETRYLSPEQIRGEPVTAQSDVYAFGILAYEVLTGRGPYDATGEAQVLVAHLRAEPRRLRELRADVDATAATLIERCLAKDPNHRPRAHDLVAALGTATATAASVDRGPLGQLLDELKRRRVYQVLVGYGAFAIAVLGAAQVVFDAYADRLSPRAYQIVVTTTLAGLPLALVLSWVYDLRAGRIQRTRDAAGTGTTHRLVWLGFAISILAVLAIGWLLLGRR